MISMIKKLMLVAVFGALLNVGGCMQRIENPELAKFSNTVEGRAAKAKYLETHSRYIMIFVPFGAGS